MIDAFFREYAKGRDWLLADGATGTNLFDMGLTSGDAPELWNAEHPDRIRRLHQGFVEAGSDLILTNSFGGNARRLALHKAEGRVHELNRLAAQHARAVADASGRPVIVAGSVGPTGDLFAPLGALTEDQAVDVFAEQIEGLQAGGADIIWIETMSALEEMRAAATAAGKVGMPYTVTASFDTAGNTMMGITPAAMIGSVGAFRPHPHGIGCNCGVGASDLLCSVLAMTAADPEATVIAKANCGIPQVGANGVTYSGTPEIMADYARLAVDAGARVIGGCCGTRPEHVLAMRRALESHRRGERPGVEQIVAAVGALASPPAREAAPRRAGRRRG
ncbi:MAG TPA: betaine--homocysteine S-methyltransferase [Acetobacteraceae bacterium]|nr:betaine--homocysteine S-methyltransferase [Acetobacteraceae bacterium]